MSNLMRIKPRGDKKRIKFSYMAYKISRYTFVETIRDENNDQREPKKKMKQTKENLDCGTETLKQSLAKTFSPSRER